MIAAAAWLLLFFGGGGLVFAFNALRPRYAPAAVAAASFFAGWLTAELSLHILVFQTFALGLLCWEGALTSWVGRVGAVATCSTIVLLLVSLRQSLASGGVVDAALVDFIHHDPPPPGLRWKPLLMPLPVRHDKVERLRNRVYHDDGTLRLRLDVFRQRDADHGPTAARRPVLIYVHGGAWVIGNKEHQGLPMLHHFAALGWVCFSINYRLSPRATFPDAIIDVKRAIAWVRAHAAEHGADPDFIVVSGNSAGGHLASLAALTPGTREWQPGFESADTSVAACLSFYGIYDFGDRHGHWHNRGLQEILQRYVMKARLADAPERFEAASPIAHVGPHAPPFLVVHGERDSLVPVAEARAFVRTLRAATSAHCVYIEVPGAQHAFEVFPSVRTLHLLRGLERFAVHVHRDYLAARVR
ncbi:MAG: carboxylesterase family protein [Myxococcales bacterium]|nr:carboxylesterase family protein [Myxococcales bacterium]